MAELPVVVLAFANEQEGRRYLRDLPEELRQLQAILEAAEGKGLCKLVARPNATLDQMIDAFTEHRDRVAILHYGGHAGGDRLFLETTGNEGAVAHAEGLATFLGQRRNLQLVFLNGCSTRAQAAGLLDAGVAAVIATARAIEDPVALAFATAFYSELASGATLRAAYEAARGRVMAARGAATHAYFRNRDLVATNRAHEDPADDRGFPWELRLAPGAELDGRWSLPEAVGNPLFGLPTPSVDWLPETPYRGLQRFTRDEAAVFFGRGRAIREIYNLVADSGTRPVILYYGPTGVGKSSVLDAGLVPRLAHSHEVCYLRRDADLGLLGTLRSGLAPADKEAVAGQRVDLARLWLDHERPDRSLIVILDQAEEAFTRPRVAAPSEGDEALKKSWIDPDAELAELMAALRATFATSDPAQRPRGKLIVSFRNEWLDRFEQAFNAVKLGWEPMPLKPIDRQGIIEAIEGPCRDPALKRRYGLTAADGLAGSIAEDLVQDAGSALAPTLQVLLTNMWKAAGGKAGRFDHDLYRHLREQGYQLHEVLEASLKEVRNWHEDVESSGLALDVLVYHVTEFGTSAQRTSAELAARYRHRARVLPGLLEKLKDGYLLVETDARSEPSAQPVPATRLAHDTLAPLVHVRFRTSIANGQRARRLLENRVVDWSGGKTGPFLDRADVVTVIEGAPGMRAWEPDEVRLVEASRREDERLRAQEAEEARRLHEAEEGRLRAEAQARQEAEQRLEEQTKANLQQIEANQRLEEANLKQRQTNKHLRQGTYLLASAVIVMVVVASIAVVEWTEVGRQRDNASNNLARFKSEATLRTLLQAEELLKADPKAVPDILTAVRASDDAMKRLQAMRSNPGSAPMEARREALALLDKHPSEADFLLREVLAADSEPAELLLVRRYLAPYLSRETADLLWKTVQSTKTAPGVRLRHAAVVAALAAEDARWHQAAGRVVADMLSVNALQLMDWTDAFRVVKKYFIPPLELQFKEGEPHEREVAATILNDYAADNIVLMLELLKSADIQQFRILFATANDHRDEAVKSMTAEVAFELLKEADPRQFPILFTKARDDPAAAVKSMTAEVGKKPSLKSVYKQRDELAGRQANALITLAMLGHTDRLWPALRLAPDPRLRTYLVQRMGRMGVGHKLLAGRLFEEKEPSIRAAIVLALGEYPYELRIGEINRLVATKLLGDYARDPDSGFHSAVAWLLPNLLCFDGQAVDESLAGKTPDPQKSWFVNKENQSFVILKDPDVFLMGSPEEENEFGRNGKERRHRRHIPRSFAIGAREVTVAEYFKFLDDPSAKEAKSNYVFEDQQQFSPNLDRRGPILSVTWFEAAQYCRWLGEQEGVPESEQCFGPIPEIKEGMVLSPDYLTRTGYRPPTEAEWEYACRAGTQTPWNFGSDKRLLKDLVWYLDNSIMKNVQPQAQEICQKMPNAFGLFDMHGNVNEWCFDRDPAYPAAASPAVDDFGNERRDRKVMDTDLRIYRGGSFAELPLNLRSAYRDGARPTNRLTSIGFRLCRTIPRKPR